MKKLLSVAVALMLLAGPAFAADEVIVSERNLPDSFVNGVPVPILGERITTQVLDVATESAAFNSATKMIRVCNNAGAALWYKIGASGVSAAANTDGNEYLPSGACVDEPLKSGDTNIDTAADA